MILDHADSFQPPYNQIMHILCNTTQYSKATECYSLYNPFHTNALSLSSANIRKPLLFMFSEVIEGNGDIKRIKSFCWLIKKESSISIRCDISGQNKKRECFFQKINYSKRQYFALTKLS